MRTLACLVAAGMLALSASGAERGRRSPMERRSTPSIASISPSHTATEIGAGGLLWRPADRQPQRAQLFARRRALCGRRRHECARAHRSRRSASATIRRLAGARRPGRSAAQRRARSRHDVQLRRHALARLGVRGQALDRQSVKRRDDAGRQHRPHDHRHSSRSATSLYGAGGRGENTFYRIDTETGAATAIGSFGVTTRWINSVSMSFDDTGVLWAVINYVPPAPGTDTVADWSDLAASTRRPAR